MGLHDDEGKPPGLEICAETLLQSAARRWAGREDRGEVGRAEDRAGAALLVDAHKRGSSRQALTKSNVSCQVRDDVLSLYICCGAGIPRSVARAAMTSPSRRDRCDGRCRPAPSAPVMHASRVAASRVSEELAGLAVASSMLRVLGGPAVEREAG